MDPPLDESQLVRRCKAGDPGAFETLMRHYEPYVLGLLWRMTGNRAAAEDLCQDSFLKVLKRIPEFRFQSSFKTWVFRIAHNAAVDHLRARHLETEGPGSGELESLPAPSSPEDPDRAIEESQMRRALKRAVDALPANQREVIHLFYWGELSVEEIARATGMPEGTVKTHLFRGRQALRAGTFAILSGGGTP